MIYGLLTVIREDHRDAHRNAYLQCRCQCGTEKIVRADHLKRGKIISCGCENKRRTSVRVRAMLQADPQRRNALGERSITHGDTESPEYRTWCAMKSRCLNENVRCYNNYGGRGITICAAWRDDYAQFLQDMGRRPSSGHSIDRINVNGNYEPSNCRWATAKEQSNNKRPRLKQ